MHVTEPRRKKDKGLTMAVVVKDGNNNPIPKENGRVYYAAAIVQAVGPNGVISRNQKPHCYGFGPGVQSADLLAVKQVTVV